MSMLSQTYIGKYYEGSQELSVSTKSIPGQDNDSYVILGESGYGKSVAAQSIVLQKANQSYSVRSIDIHNSSAPEHLFPTFRKSFEQLSSRIDAYNTPIPTTLFEPLHYADGTMESPADLSYTLSNIIANELGVGFKVTSGPVLDKPGDLAGVLTSLEPNDVLFIDEIHRLSPVVEEYLYSAMEDYRIDIMIDKGPSARSIQIDLNPFTLVGATTRSGLLTAPLRARFGINLHLEYYDDDILSNIIRRSASILDVPCSVRAASEIASRSRGTPRIANALLRRVRDFAQVKGTGSIDTEIAQFALEALNIDKYGLDEIDNKILCTIIDKFKGGPVGLTTIATALGEDAGTIEEVYEPFLIKEGFMKRTPRGREVTELAYKHLGRSLYSSQKTLFND